MQVPPNPSAKSRTSPVIVAIAVTAALVFLVSCGIVLAFLAVRSSKPAALRTGFGAPRLLTRSDDGWWTYEFPDCGLTMEIPGEPAPRTPKVKVKRTQAKEYASYAWTSKLARWDLTGYWKGSGHYSIQTSLRTYEKQTRAKFPEVKIGTSNRGVAGQPGTFIKMEYISAGRPTTSYCLIWTKDDAMFYMRQSHLSKFESSAFAGWERVVNSIR